MIASELPDDIWINILQRCRIDNVPLHPIASQKGLESLTLTSRRLRQLALPIRYHALAFFYLASRGDPTLTLLTLINALKRAQNLIHAPHLLQHVRQFSLHWWSEKYPDIFGGGGCLERGREDVHGATRNGEGLYEVIYDLVASLIIFLPGLQHFEIENSPITLRLYHYLASRPRLQSISVNTFFNSDPVPVEFPTTLRIRSLKYTSHYSGTATDVHFPYILNNCGPYLKKLDIRPAQIPTVISYTSTHSLLLEELRVWYRTEDSMESLLRALPSLSSLDVFGMNPELQLSHLGADVLPNLESISGTPGLVRVLTMGRNISNVFIRGALGPEVFSITDIVRSPTLHLHRLNLDLHIGSYCGLFTFLRSLYPFQNLERLDVKCNELYTLSRDDMTRETFCVNMADALRQLPLLRKCCIFSFASGAWIEDTCPIAKEGDPTTRGYKCLEGFSIQHLSRDWWAWIPGQGWTRTPFDQFSRY